MKKLQIILSLLVLFGLAFFNSCEKPEKENELSNETQDEVVLKSGWPDVYWQIGLSATLYRPKFNCQHSFGICRINAIFVMFDWDKRLAPIDFGVALNENTLIVEFQDQLEISSYAMQDFIEIEEGEELIDIDYEVISRYSKQNIDISTIKLIPGKYYLQLNAETNNYFVSLPFEY